MKWLPSLRRDTSDSEAASAASTDPGDAPTGTSPVSTLVDSPLASPLVPAASQVAGSGAGDAPASQSWLVDVAATELLSKSESDQEAAHDVTAGPTSGAPLVDAFEKLREELLLKQQALNDEQRNLNELFSTRLRSDEAQGRAVEKLHDELRQYKTNFVRQQLLPVLKEVIFCHDFVVAQSEKVRGETSHSEKPASDAAERPETSVFDATRQMLIDLLYKYDVEPFRTEEERFDPKTQQCTQTVPTPVEAADKTVAARGLPGFRGPEGIVRREQVTVYKFTPGAE